MRTTISATESCFGLAGPHQHAITNIPDGTVGTPLSGSSTYNECGKLGWEQQNCYPTANVWEGGSSKEIAVTKMVVRMRDVLATPACC